MGHFMFMMMLNKLSIHLNDLNLFQLATMETKAKLQFSSNQTKEIYVRAGKKQPRENRSLFV